MDEKLTIFNAIVAFVADLDTEFGKKYKPVALYNRLVSKTTPEDDPAIDRHIEAFRTFFKGNKRYIDNGDLSGDAKIVYSERIYLHLGRILSKTDNEAHKHIHKHLATIYSLMHIDTEDGQRVLEGLRTPQQPELNLPNTTEGNFVKETLDEMTAQFKNMDLEENPNPMALMGEMMQSGFLQKFMGDMKQKMESGEMDLQSLMGTVTGVIADAAPEGSDQAESIRNFMNNSMATLGAATQGEGQPPDMANLLGPLMGSAPQPPLQLANAVNEDEEEDED